MKSFFTAIIGSTLTLCSSIAAQTLAESQQDYINTKAPSELTWKTFDAVVQHASQDEQERRYHKIKWHNSLVDAQQAAHKADKPILMILFFGDHRSNC